VEARATHLLLTEVDLLDSWADRLRFLWSSPEGVVGVFLVGTALTSKDYRDVDVRIVLTDETVAHLDRILHRPTLGLALSHEGQRATGLPIDCQVQSLTESGQEASKPDTATPRPLGYRFRAGARVASREG
jgi:hypothetical protein